MTPVEAARAMRAVSDLSRHPDTRRLYTVDSLLESIREWANAFPACDFSLALPIVFFEDIERARFEDAVKSELPLADFELSPKTGKYLADSLNMRWAGWRIRSGNALINMFDVTDEMIEAHQAECAGDADEAGPERIRACWRSMLEEKLRARTFA